MDKTPSVTIVSVDAYTVVHLKPAIGRGRTYYYDLAEDGQILSGLGFGPYLYMTLSSLPYVPGGAGMKLMGLAAVFAGAFGLLTSGFGTVVDQAPEPYDNNEPADEYAAVRFPITQRQYEELDRDLNHPRCLAVYSRPFFNCTHFAVRLMRRHGVPLPASRFFATPESLRRCIRAIQPEGDVRTWSYGNGRAASSWRYIFPFVTL